MSYRLRSLLLTGVFGFVMPLFVIVGLFATLLTIGLLPFCQPASLSGTTAFINILQTFGNGDTLHGFLTIGVVGATVSILFDACNSLVLSKPIR